MSTDHAPAQTPAECVALAAALRALLHALPPDGPWLTYQQAAVRLGLRPPLSVRRTIEALEQLMREDAAAAHPLLAARVIGRVRDGVPAPGFYALANELGLYSGPESGPLAAEFHRSQLQALRQVGTRRA